MVTIDEIKSIMVAWLMPKLPKFLKNSCMLMSDPGHKDNDIRWCIMSPLTHNLVIGAYVHKYANVGDIDIWTGKFNGYRNINIRIDNQSWDGPKAVWYPSSEFDCFSKEEMYELYGMIGKYVYNKYHKHRGEHNEYVSSDG
jgi:hypothetical protein